MDTRPVFIVDGVTREAIAAVLHLRLPTERVEATEDSWQPYRRAADDEAEHTHWDWRRKARMLVDPNIRCMGVEHNGEVQGLMMVMESGPLARFPPDRDLPLVYVDYLESAPWNVRRLTLIPKYRDVGPVLLAAAVRLSLELGYNGRIGLHSLAQAEGFYEEVCGMTAWGQDPNYYSLMYYEFTAVGAAAFLEDG
jgi:hypothetical protein